MGDPIRVDVFSATTVPLEMMINTISLSVGTGFIWRSTDTIYLITNWHNLSGRDANTEANISRTGAWPNRLRVYLNTKGRLGQKYEEIFELYDHNGKPNWIIRPTMGHKVDIAALPLLATVEPDWYAMNELPTEDLSLTIGQDVFILGYPFGIGPGGYPIWKRASVASEPEVLFDDHPYILVDTASRQGMSGSPVIRRSWGNHIMAGGGVLTGPGTMTKFVGIYSGRLKTTDQADAQLGRVWPATLIEQIIAGGPRDS